MIRNYLLTTLRNIKNSKGYVFINFAGPSGGIALTIAILTVSYQAILAAITSPEESLKYE